MLGSKFDRDLPLINQNWNNFISLVRQDLQELIIQQRNLEIEIKKVERIEKIVNISENDIHFFLTHKELFLQANKMLESKFKVLEAFDKRNNLDNDLAILTYQQILNDNKILEMINQLETLINQNSILQNQIESLQDLIYGEDYSQLDFISELCKKYNIGSAAQKMIFMYPIIKTLKTNKVVKEKTAVDKNQTVVSKNTIIEEMTIVDDISNTIIDKDTEISEETTKTQNFNFQKLFEIQKNRYNKLKENQNKLLNKYYIVLQEMKPHETTYYRTFCSYNESEFKNIDKDQFENGYDEAVSKIYAIKVFDDKSEIEKTMESIVMSNYSNDDDIEYLGEVINEFQSLCDKLSKVDKKIIDKSITSIDESKVFFLMDRNSSSSIFIPKEIINDDTNRGSLITIMKKAEEGIVSKKQGNIQPLKIQDKQFKSELRKTIFSIRSPKILVSYIKLNMVDQEISNDCGIMILTASLISNGIDGIQKATNKVVRENSKEILRQIKLIEKKDPQQIGLQSLIRDEIMQSGKYDFEEGEVNGYKFG